MGLRGRVGLIIVFRHISFLVVGAPAILGINALSFFLTVKLREWAEGIYNNINSSHL